MVWHRLPDGPRAMDSVDNIVVRLNAGSFVGAWRLRLLTR
jgi:hypothetical protein